MAPKRRGRAVLRGDIQALRALAVTAVVIYHLWPRLLPGGYLGVDVFFVISGFLITSHLVGEYERTGRLRAGEFLARRAKRLLPASALVLITTGVTVLAVVPGYLWSQWLREIAASVLQLENWKLAHDSVDYLAADNTASPVQHYWTLSAEEQFYLALPLLLIAVTALARRLRRPARPTIATFFAAVVIASLSWSVVQTRSAPSLAYFSTLTRAWEFGTGALLAALLPRIAGWGAPRAVRATVPWLGVAAIAVACLVYDAHTAFPGYAAVLPVLAAAAAIWAGHRSGLARIGSWAPVALLGRISFAAYLWHWPLIVLYPYALHRPLTDAARVALLMITVAVAWLSTNFVEDPMRFNPRLLGARRPRAIGLITAAAVGCVVALAAGGVHVQDDRRARLDAQLAALTVQSIPRCLGAQAMDPALAPCVNHNLDGTMVPAIDAAADDNANDNACFAPFSDNGVHTCSFGPHGAAQHVLVVGDSHSNQWMYTWKHLAQTYGWRVDVAGFAGCYLTTAAQAEPLASYYHQCQLWRQGVLHLAATGGYTVIVVTHSADDRAVLSDDGSVDRQATVDGLVAAWRQLPDVPILALRDNPTPRTDMIDCVQRHPDTAAATCARPRDEALEFDGQARAATQVPRARVIDLTAMYCTATTCPPVIGNVLVYRDHSHLTATWTKTMTPYLLDAIDAALR